LFFSLLVFPFAGSDIPLEDPAGKGLLQSLTKEFVFRPVCNFYLVGNHSLIRFPFLFQKPGFLFLGWKTFLGVPPRLSRRSHPIYNVSRRVLFLGKSPFGLAFRVSRPPSRLEYSFFFLSAYLFPDLASKRHQPCVTSDFSWWAHLPEVLMFRGSPPFPFVSPVGTPIASPFLVI